MKREKKALENFSMELNCAQATPSAFAEELGVEEKKALKLASGFGGGMGRLAGTCGAVTGAVMVIGLRYGYTAGDDKDSKDHTYRLVRHFARQFNAKNGSIICKELLGHDVSTTEGYRDAVASGGFKTICPGCVQSAVTILEEILED